jgi:outer membrane biosynthesis protein TonB
MSEKLQELKLREMQMPDPPPETVERIWRAVHEQVASGQPPPLELKGGPLVAELPVRVVTLKLVLGGALVLLGVVGAGVVGSRWRAEGPAEIERDVAIEGSSIDDAATEVAVDAPPSQPIEPSQPIAPIVANDTPPENVAPPTSDVVTPKPKPKPEPEPEPKPRTLADEVALIQAISKSLKQSEWKSVLKLVAEHEREFANGQFVEERQAAKVRAQCRSGALDAGREAAERFTARWPTSIHRATIREDCDL